MIPRLDISRQIEPVYGEFLQTLTKHHFKGEIRSHFAARIVAATDNSIYQQLPQAILYPTSTADIIIICQLAREPRFERIQLAARGGGTGTNGQSLTSGLIVDCSRHLNNILEINIEQGWARVQPGVIKDQLDAAVRQHGLFFAPELSTSSRATIGGMINTDASGQGSCIYGKTRNHVIELQTILLDGSVLQSRALNEEELYTLSNQHDKVGLIHRVVNSIQRDGHANSAPQLRRHITGYNLANIRDSRGHFNLNSLICGSEGTLGFVSEAKVQLTPLPKHRVLAVITYHHFIDALHHAPTLIQAQAASIETLDDTLLQLAQNDVCWQPLARHFSADSLNNIAALNIVEFCGNHLDELTLKARDICEHYNHQCQDNQRALVINHRNDIHAFWAMRKRAVGLLGATTGENKPQPFIEDCAVPPEYLAEFISKFREILDDYTLHYGMFGHIDAGVMHVRPALDMKNPKHEKIAWELSDKIAHLVGQYHGVLWGEHGKGLRSEYAPKFFGENYLQLQRIKAAFDPHNQLNPGKIATPADHIPLTAVDSTPTKGQHDRKITPANQHYFASARHCNGNAACTSWDKNQPLCPSWHASGDRIQSPKGRAALIREWIKQLSLAQCDITQQLQNPSALIRLSQLPLKAYNSWRKMRGQYDFSHEVFASLQTCLSCKACASQCPIKVDIADFRSDFLTLYYSRYLRPLRDYAIANIETVLPIIKRFGDVYNRALASKRIQNLFEWQLGLCDLPALAATTTKTTLTSIPLVNTEYLQQLSVHEKQRTVILVQDSFTSTYEQQVVIDIYRLLKHWGFHCYLAPLQPQGKAQQILGFKHAFAKTARKNWQQLTRLADCGVPLVGIDPATSLSYRLDYPQALAPQQVHIPPSLPDTYHRHKTENRDASNRPKPSVLLLQEWLATQVDILQHHKAHTATTFYLLGHCTETSTIAKNNHYWSDIFKALGHHVEIIQTSCCGMAGTFGHLSQNKDMSKKIYQQSWQNPVKKHAPSGHLLATGYSCRSQVKRFDNITLAHPLQALLAQELEPLESMKSDIPR